MSEVLAADYQEPDAFDPGPAAAPAAETADAVAERAVRALSAAVRAGQRDLVRFLLAAPGFDVAAGLSARDPATGNSPLHFAVLSNEAPDLLEDLLRARADPGARNRQGRTPLHLAEAKGRFKFVQVLRDFQVADSESSGPVDLAGAADRVTSAALATPPRVAAPPGPRPPPPLPLAAAAAAAAAAASAASSSDDGLLSNSALLVSGRGPRHAGDLLAQGLLHGTTTPPGLLMSARAWPPALESAPVRRAPAHAPMPGPAKDGGDAESQELMTAMLEEIMDLRGKVRRKRAVPRHRSLRRDPVIVVNSSLIVGLKRQGIFWSSGRGIRGRCKSALPVAAAAGEMRGSCQPAAVTSLPEPALGMSGDAPGYPLDPFPFALSSLGRRPDSCVRVGGNVSALESLDFETDFERTTPDPRTGSRKRRRRTHHRTRRRGWGRQRGCGDGVSGWEKRWGLAARRPGRPGICG